MRVLVVDDMPETRARLAALIGGVPGVREVGQAADGIETMADVVANSPDVVVLDLQMPRMNGFRTMDALHACADKPATIVVSNHTEYRDHALRAGAALFFDKATQLDALVSAIAGMAAAHAAADK